MNLVKASGPSAWDLSSIHPGILRFSAAIDAYPAAFSGDALNLLFLEDAEAIRRPKEFLRQLDAPHLLEERRQYVVGDHSCWPFPAFSLRERPDPWLVSWRLFDHFQEATQILGTQRQIGGIIENQVRQHAPDVVVLMIVDGLSYYDLPDHMDAEPCLVDGVTVTEFGYLQVIGSPEISRRLFAAGYKEQAGFTYYAPQPGTLAAYMLAQFSPSQIIQVRSFPEILRYLDKKHITRGYIQVAAPGLDQIAHAHHDQPPRDRYLRDTLNRFEKLVDCLAKQKRRVLAVLTADHGILWREIIEDKVQLVGGLLPEDSYHPRYIEGHFIREYGRCRTALNRNYTLLRIPCLTRNLRSNEWGVHGGISAWESIVPLMIRHA